VLLSGPDDEHSAGADTTLSPDALDLVTRAKAAVDADPKCAYKVSCADILALAARDVVSQVLCLLLLWPLIHPTKLQAAATHRDTPLSSSPEPSSRREFVGAVVSLDVTFGATDEQRAKGMEMETRRAVSSRKKEPAFFFQTVMPLWSMGD
jgi:hypothetical protein